MSLVLANAFCDEGKPAFAPSILELAPAKPLGGVPGAEKKPSIRIEVDPVVRDPSDRKPGTIPGPGVKTVLEPAVPPELIGLAREAKEQFERGNYREAEQIYRKALTLAPNNLYILSNQGVVYFRGQKYKLAEEALKKAIAIAPEDDFSHCALGIVYYSQGKLDEAINQLTKALAINPKNATAHNYLGIVAGLSDSTYRAPATSAPVGDFLTPLEKSRLKVPPRGYRPLLPPSSPPVRQ